MSTIHLEAADNLISLISGNSSKMTRPEQEASYSSLGGVDPKIRLILESEAGKHPYLARFDRNYSPNYVCQLAFGLPVVKDVLISVDRRLGTLIYTPQITADGSALYGKARLHSELNNFNGEEKIPPSDLDNFFTALMSMDFVSSAILAQISAYAVLAANNDYYLAEDDPFELHLFPDHSWDVVSLDLERAGFYPNDEQKDGMSKNVLDHFNLGPYIANMTTCSRFWRNLHGIKDLLKSKKY